MYPPVELYASAALLLIVSTLVGWAVQLACGRDFSWLAPALGLAALIVVAGATIRMPGDAGTALGALAVVLVGALVLLRRRRPTPTALRAALPVVVAIVVAMSLPFVFAGAFGAFSGKSNDLGYYLYDAQWLQTHSGFEPGQIAQGYPMGPPALVAVTANVLGGANLVAVFGGLMVVIAVATALASLEVLNGLSRAKRAVGATLVGLPYMGASFYLQSSFKELAMGLFVLAFSITLADFVGRPNNGKSPRPAFLVLPAVLIAASVYTYSFAGAYWPVVTLAFSAVLIAGFRRHGLRHLVVAVRPRLPRTRRGRALTALAGVVAVGVVVQEWSQVSEFARARGSLGALNGGDAAGDLPGTPWFYTALGIWPVSDYRAPPPGLLVERLLFAVALFAFVRGALSLWRRGEPTLLAGAGAAIVVYLLARIGSGPYVQSKALAVMAPLLMLVAIRGIFWPLETGRDWARRTVRVLGIVFAGGAAFSTYLALAGASVNGGQQARQLEALGRMVQGSRVMFLGADDYVGWELRGAGVLSTDPNSGVPVVSPRPSLPQIWPHYDFDSLRPRDLDLADYVIAARDPVSSRPPPNLTRVAQTKSFLLYRRRGPTPPRGTLREGPLPGQVLDCSTPRGRALSRRRAAVADVWRTPPVLGPYESWAASSPNPIAAGFGARVRTALVPGREFTQSLALPAGRWAISLQYTSSKPLRLHAPGLDVTLPPNFERPGSFWPVGILRRAAPATVTFHAELAPQAGWRDVLSGPDELQTGFDGLLAGIAATRVGQRPAAVLLKEACGTFVDSYRPRR